MHKKEKIWWVPDDKEVWALARQAGDPLPNGCMKFNLIANGKQTMMSQELCLETQLSATELDAAPDDMIGLPEVNQASILSCIRNRFNKKNIYTAIGTVLMSVNPFETIPGLYGVGNVYRYMNPYAENGEGALAPHVYLVPSRAFADMARSGLDQSILISGESGAGKTEATKSSLQFLTIASELAANPSAVPGKDKRSSVSFTKQGIQLSGIAGRVIAASPILEAFGNAKTIRNPNSSRFGKWLELIFNSRNALSGSIITSYLLEKSRVTRRDPEERNYHIFYQLLRGLKEEALTEYNLHRNTSKYRYLQRTGTTEEAVDLNDSKNFEETQNSFREMGFSDEEIATIEKIIGGVLHLGNIDFVDKDHGEASAVEPNNESNRMAAQLFSVQEASLASSLCHRTMTSGTMRRSVITITLSPQLAADARDTLARTIYDKIFLDIIQKINDKSGTELLNSSANYRKKIGLLDIFGFEIFPINSLEQLCINYCNEMLQNHFNFVIFTAEKNLYAAEGIVCNSIEFRDNLPIIQDIDKLFKSLDEEAKIPKGTSKTWYEKLRKAGAGNKTSSVLYPPRKDIFTVKHYAGNVDYSPLGCMEKNTEVLTNELIMTMAMSSEPSIQRMFGAPEDDPSDAGKDDGGKPAASKAGATSSTVGKKIQKSISWKFTNQLTSLMAMLKTTQSHFIRTVKSNEACKPLQFDAQLVNKQLLYSGVFEVVKIQQSGLPCRIQHRDFIDRFRCLAPTSIRWRFQSCKDLINTLKARPLEYDLPQMQVGTSLVFFKTFEQRLLESKREELLYNSTVTLQKFLQCRSRRRLYFQLIAVLAEFNSLCTQFDSGNAKKMLKFIEEKCVLYEKLSGYPILANFFKKKVEYVEVVRQREVLVNEANQLLTDISETSLISMQRVVQRAKELDISTHSVITQCNEFVVNYELALSYIDKFASEDSLSNLTMDEINLGIDILTGFLTIMDHVSISINRAEQWRTDIESEFEVTFRELMKYLEDASMKYDDIDVSMRSFDPSALALLSDYHKVLDPSRFKCKDTKDLYADCETVLYLMEVVLVNEDGDEAVHIAETALPHYEITEEQLEEFRKWGSVHAAVKKLKANLLTGRIPGTAIGTEEAVDALSIKTNLDKLKQLPNPPPKILSVLVVADWIYLLRDLFVQRNFEGLEKLTYAVEDEINKGHFDMFPDCIKEFENCIWLTSYQNALADVFYIINEPIFVELPISSVDWTPITYSISQGTIALNTASEFASPLTSPALIELIPLARSIIQLHQCMFDMDIDVCKGIVSDITTGKFASIVKSHNLENTLTEEMKACSKLIQIVECEEELNAALLTDQVGIFQTDNNDGTAVTPKQCSINCSGKVSRLKKAVDEVHKIQREEEELPISLVNILFAGEKMLFGREALAKDEEDPSMNWDEVVRQLEEAPEGKFILDDYQREYHHIILECSRRTIWNLIKKVLGAKCVVGARYIDIHVDQTVFMECEQLLETIATRLSDELPSPPGNLMHLLAFTRMLMTVRRALFSLNWSEVYISLAKLQPLLNDDALAVPGVIEEVDTIRCEYIAHQEVVEMKDAMRDTLPFIADDISIENKQMRIDRIEDAIFLLKKHQGPCAARLIVIATKVISICTKLLQGEVGTLPESALIEVISLMEAEKLSVDEMQQVLQFVRLRQILKNICDAITMHATSDLISKKLDTVRGEHTMPKELLPWLHAADAYSQLLQAIEHVDWVLVVNRCRYLEEVIEPLAAMDRHDADNERILIDMARLRYREGYKLAMKIKADEEEIAASANSAAVSTKDIKRKRLIAEDEENPYGVTALRKAGYSDLKILESNFPIPTLWAVGFDASLLRAKGFNAAKLKSSGYSCADLIAAGFTVEQLARAGFSPTELQETGSVAVTQLRDAGYQDSQILMAGYPIHALKASGYDAPRLTKSGVTLRELAAAGFDARDLRLAGFDAIQLRRNGFDDAKVLRDAGFELAKLRMAGFEPIQLRIAGFDYQQLKAEGFTDIKLLSAGFLNELAFEALVDFFNSTKGKRWKIRLNWCSNKPFREWYGIRTEIIRDSNGYEGEYVVGIDLHDNNLSGYISPKIWLLVHLRYLSLSMNDIGGHIPLCLSQMPQLQLLDLTNNPELKPPDPNATNDLGVFDGGIFPNPKDAKNNNAVDEVNIEEVTKKETAALVDFYHTSHGIKWKTKKNWCTPHPLKDWFGVSVNRFGFITKLIIPSNSLLGSIPESIDSLVNLRELDLRYNQLSGSIPASICNLPKLTHLHLHCNRFSGPIPEEIGNLKSLVILDLRSNQLTGTVPDTIMDLKMLNYIALTSNLLSIPDKQAIKERLPWCRAVVL